MQTTVLNNGVELPAIGLGVFQTPPDVTAAAVEEALLLDELPRKGLRGRIENSPSRQ